MIKDRNRVSEKILNLTLEIICLLTGEDYMVVKKQSNHDTDSSGHCESEGLCWTQNTFMDHPPNLLTRKRRINNEILEPTKDLPLPTSEVTIRCDDVAVYLSMEEWEYFKKHKEHYKELMRKNRQPPSERGRDDVTPDLITRNESASEPRVADLQGEIIHSDTCAGESSNTNKQERRPISLHPQDCKEEANRTTQDNKNWKKVQGKLTKRMDELKK
ncbi:oocyte zinc finger protein XlCOF8.4-like [Rhinophrynus dorsalis]